MKNSASKEAWFAAFAVIAAVAPFMGKAFHIDDTLFMWMAHQIAVHPEDPYGFSVNWYSAMQLFSRVMENPPLTSYYAALVGRFLGWSEPAMHIGFLLPAIAAIVGTFFLARRLSDSPLRAALLTLFTPVFLVSATTVMCDVWLLAFWVWSIECWLGALKRNAWWLYLVSTSLASAAVLTKYFGLSLVPLLFVFTLVHDRRFTFRLLFLVIPLFAVAWYETMSKAKYGIGLFGNAVSYPWTQISRPGQHIFKPMLAALTFTGGGLFSCLFFAPLFKRRVILLAAAIIFVIFLPILYFAFASRYSAPSAIIAITTEGALFAATGLGIFALAFADLFQRRTAESMLLVIWVTGTFLFASLLNWSVTSRSLLPMAPAVAILLVRRLSMYRSGESMSIRTWWPLLPAAMLSLLVTNADYRLANIARSAATKFRDQFRGEPGMVWFEGHWGFQYYMQQWGAKPVDVDNIKLIPGDILIVPFGNTNLYRLPGIVYEPPEHVYYQLPWVATMSVSAGAGFYSNFRGPLPWIVTYIPPERYDVLRVR